MDRSTDNSTAPLLDRIAIAFSALCMLHCIALPLLLLAVPLFEEFARDHFHLQVLVFVLPVSIVALTLGYQRHRHAGVLLWGASGLGLLLLGATWGHSQLGLTGDRLLTVSGSIVLAATHFANSRLGRRHLACVS